MLVYGFGCVGAGAAALLALAPKRRLHEWRELPLLATAFLLGQGVMAAIWVPLALSGSFSRTAILSIVAPAALGGIAFAGWALGDPRARIKQWAAAGASFSRPGRICAGGLALLIGAFGVAAWVTPPIGDAEAFYMTYARLIAASHRLEPMPGIYEAFSTIGLLGEMHLAALIAISGAPAAKLFVWLVGLAGAAMLDFACRQCGAGALGRFVALAMLFTSTAFTYHLFDGKVDLFGTSLGLVAAVWCIAIGPGKDRLRRVALVGLCTGFAVVAKISLAAGLVPAIVALLLWRTWRQSERARRLMATFAVFGAFMVVAATPHFLKNAMLFGAPLAPFIAPSEDQGWLQQVWFPAEVTWRIVLTYPFALVLGRYPMQGGNLSYLLLAFLPLAWWLRGTGSLRESPERKLFVAALIGLLSWIVLRPSIIAPRYILTTLLLFYPAVAKATEHAYKSEVGRPYLRAAILGLIASALLASAFVVRKPVKHAFAGGDDPCALASHYCGPLTALNRRAAPGDRVFFAGYYSYWLRDDLLQCRDRGAETRMQRPERLDELSWQELARKGFRWVVIDRSSHQRVWQGLSKTSVPGGMTIETLWDKNDVLVLGIEGAERRAAPACRQVRPPAWIPVA